MITATAILRGTITATAVIFSTKTGSCAAATAVLKDTSGNTLSTTIIPSGDTENITAPNATVNVNSNFFYDVESGGLINVPVEYENGTPVGTIVLGIVEIPNPVVCADATVNVNGNLFDTVASGGTVNVPVENTAGTALGSKVGSDWQIPDETYRTYLNGVLQSTVTNPALQSVTININFT